MAIAKHSTAELLAARREGLSYAAIAARFDITKQAAWERITRAEKAAASPFDRVVELRNAGKTAKEIEKKTGFSHAVVLKHISSGIAAGRIARRVVLRRDWAYRARKAKPAAAPAEPAVTYTLPPDFDPAAVDTATASDVIAIVERPITEDHDDYLPEPEQPVTVEVKPRRAPSLNAAYVAEVFYRHGPDEVRRRWPEVSDEALDEAIRVGKRMVAPPTDDLPKGWGTRLAGAIARLFGRS